MTRLLQEDKESLRDLLRSAAKVARSLDKLLGENEAEVKKLLTDLDRLTAETAELVAKLDKGVGTGEELHKTLANIESISTELKTELAPLLQRPSVPLDGVGTWHSSGPEERKSSSVRSTICLCCRARCRRWPAMRSRCFRMSAAAKAPSAH